MRLLFRPPPMPDEWIGSWIVRLSAVNNFTFPANPQKLLNALGIDTVQEHLSEEQLKILSAATGVDLTQLRTLNSMPEDVIQNIGRSSSRITMPTPFLGVRFLVVCPKCLEGDQEPYFRRSWLNESTVACPTHGGPPL